MRKSIFLGAAALVTMIATDPAFCLQVALPAGEATQTDPTDPSTPPVPPLDDPSQPTPPITEPLPPEMPPVAGEGQANPPAPPVQPIPPAEPTPPVMNKPVINRDVPVGPMATAPITGGQRAESGGTTQSMLMPQPAIKTYPPCSRTLQDNCRNPNEGSRKSRKKLR